jgi:hypothetical protein
VCNDKASRFLHPFSIFPLEKDSRCWDHLGDAFEHEGVVAASQVFRIDPELLPKSEHRFGKAF